MVALKQVDPERYKSLTHPGDDYSYDIDTRAARIVRGANEVDVLDGLKPKLLIGAGGPAFASDPLSALLPDVGSTPVQIRDDLSVPVFQFETETDVHGMLQFRPSRQQDSDRLRTWEVAGTAHVDMHVSAAAHYGTGEADNAGQQLALASRARAGTTARNISWSRPRCAA